MLNKRNKKNIFLAVIVVPALITLAGCASRDPLFYDKKIGEMRQGNVIAQMNSETGEPSKVWLADQTTYKKYPVKQIDGVWILTPEGLAQRDLDKRELKEQKEKKKKAEAQSYYGSGEGDGGEGGGGD